MGWVRVGPPTPSPTACRDNVRALFTGQRPLTGEPRGRLVVLEGILGQRCRFHVVVPRHARRRSLIGAFVDFAKQFAKAVQSDAANNARR